MKRLSLVAMLLLGSALGAHADNDVYNNITRHPRSDEALQADTSACSRMLGAPQSRRTDVTAIQELHARSRLALQSYGARTPDAGAHVSRSG